LLLLFRPSTVRRVKARWIARFGQASLGGRGFSASKRCCRALIGVVERVVLTAGVLAPHADSAEQMLGLGIWDYRNTRLIKSAAYGSFRSLSRFCANAARFALHLDIRTRALKSPTRLPKVAA